MKQVKFSQITNLSGQVLKVSHTLSIRYYFKLFIPSLEYLYKYNLPVLLIVLISFSCTTKKAATKQAIVSAPQNKETFILKPFGYEPNIRNFKTNLPSSFKLQIYSMKNMHNPAVIDTIYKFYQRKSTLLIYKNAANRELFFAGNIYNSKIQLKNGVKVGMTRTDFFRCFSDLKPNSKDTIRVSSKKAPNSINFIFKKDKLNVIKIDYYID
jgi:hypothetical protein